MSGTEPIFACYDGSPGARGALARAAALFPGHPVVVGCAWQPVATINRYDPLAVIIDSLAPPAREIDELAERAAVSHAEEGAQMAREAGLEPAEAVVLRAKHGIARALLDAARKHDSAVVAVGARGTGRVEAALLGSVSRTVAARADRPVLLVPVSNPDRHER